MTGDFPLIIGFIFDLFISKPYYSMHSEHLEYGMSYMGSFNVCKNIGHFQNLLNGQVHTFFICFDNIFVFWAEKK